MKLCCFIHDGQKRIGKILDGKIFDYGLAGDLGILGFDENAKTSMVIDLDLSKLCCPVPRPNRIFGLGLNYKDHCKETGRELPKNQTWFMKQFLSANDPFGEIIKPIVSDMIDFEAELVVVIGKKCRHLPKESAMEAVFGYCVGNDVSVRDWQAQSPTMNLGKGFDTHAPFGPWLVTPDELGDLNRLGIRSYLNGQLMQNSTLDEMHFKIPDMIEHLSKAMTLLSGDIIYTGTPSGVGIARNPQIWLKHGDILRTEIDEIGFIENKIINEVKKTVLE